MSSCLPINGRSARRLSQISSHFLSYPSRLSTRRFLRSTTLSTNATKAGEQSGASDTNYSDVGVERLEMQEPNESWSKETLALYNKLNKEVEQSKGTWMKHVAKTVRDQSGNRTFTRCLDENGKLFEYCLFYSMSEEQLKGVCQFGSYTKGPDRLVHGGAIATMLDVVTVILSRLCLGKISMTANLSVSFKKPVPIGATILLESKIESVEGRKLFVYGELKSPDGLQIYATAKTLCIEVCNSVQS